MKTCACGCGERVSSLNRYPYIWRHIPEDFELPKPQANTSNPNRRRYADHELIEMLTEWADEHGRTPTRNDKKGLPTIDTYAARFGSWTKALKKAGLTRTVKKRTNYNPVARDAVFAAIDEGYATKREIMNATGFPESSVRYVLYHYAKPGRGLERTHHGGNDYTYRLVKEPAA